ncbi:MAG: flagellar hook-basal body complex protein FliE [Euryarchaeota archaeon]|nr:flagellar hook-basal body complex protein FliE [Euryarchaeota archaeon]MBU4491141.1 flagellar hook-basal body complex protein FliE [Euryarchaeota archaeon]MCG2727830.1 flagellar hook-basal body complex protein FliE [Candidatus Methanoperedenaceae archaeon]
MKLIAFVGMPASGKSEAAAIAQRLSVPVINMGDIVREETAKRGLPPTDENIGGTGTALRREEGMDAVAKRCVQRIPLSSPVVVVDGTRNIEEINYFKKTFGDDFKLIAIHTPFELRFERVKRRSRSDDTGSIHELKRRDEREKGWGLDKAIQMAEATIENTDTIEKFRKQIEELLKDL